MTRAIVPKAMERTPETQQKLDRLQELRDRRPQQHAKRPAPATVPVPAPALPFPSSPPTKTPSVSPPTPQPTKQRPKSVKLPPITDCAQCSRQIFPKNHCTCGTVEERDRAWRMADDRWFKDNPKMWCDHHAPPARTDRAEIEAELDVLEVLFALAHGEALL
ncbi:hypothetical protein DFH09DRAFT_1329818 [Mycena vulgaris]|nr:hypothetical protein DFH09DRAFT_1329818 [Mycena vulgaris]